MTDDPFDLSNVPPPPKLPPRDRFADLNQTLDALDWIRSSLEGGPGAIESLTDEEASEAFDLVDRLRETALRDVGDEYRHERMEREHEVWRIERGNP